MMLRLLVIAEETSNHDRAWTFLVMEQKAQCWKKQTTITRAIRFIPESISLVQAGELECNKVTIQCQTKYKYAGSCYIPRDFVAIYQSL
jgi:hypothetical protein